jgi:hypothetical protein
MVQFAVTMKAGEWTVFKDGAVVEQGLSRSGAVELAERLAFDAEEAGEDVDLVIQGYTGELTDRHSGGGRPARRKPS